MDLMSLKALLGGAYIFVMVFLFVLAIAWIVMPFAIIGTKPLLRRLIKALEENNRLLTDIRTHVRPEGGEDAPRPAGWFGARKSG